MIWIACKSDGWVKVFRRDGRVNVWLPRDGEELADGNFAAAVEGAGVAEGFGANVSVHGEAGVAYLYRYPLDGKVVARWLKAQGIDGALFLPGCDLLDSDLSGGFGVDLRDEHRDDVRATNTLGWLDPVTKTVIATRAKNDRPVFEGRQPTGQYHDLSADGTAPTPGPAVVALTTDVRPPADGTVNPDAPWRQLNAARWLGRLGTGQARIAAFGPKRTIPPVGGPDHGGPGRQISGMAGPNHPARQLGRS